MAETLPDDPLATTADDAPGAARTAGATSAPARVSQRGHRPGLAALMAVLSAMCGAGIGAFGRALGDLIPSMQLAWMAFTVNTVVLAFIAAMFGVAILPRRRLPIYLARGCAGATAFAAFIFTVGHMPLIDATALSFAMPLAIIPISVVVLGERIGWRRWLATIAGFCGVLVMTRPGFLGAAGLDVPLWIYGVAMVNCFGAALGISLIRKLTDTEHPLTLAVGFGLFAIPIAAVPAMLVWRDPTVEALWLFAGFALCGLMAQQTLIAANRFGEASFVAPFDYLRMVFTGVIAFAVWREVPDLWVLAGTAIVLASSAYILLRSHARGQDVIVVAGDPASAEAVDGGRA